MVIYRDGDKDEILVVKRPEDDEDHPGIWGLPATSLDEGENWEDAVHRAAREKLGIQIKVVDKLSEGHQLREDFDITLRNYEVEIVSGEPECPQEGRPGTQYDDWKWAEPEILQESAEAGSLCCTLFLDSNDIGFEMKGNVDRESIQHFGLEPLAVPHGAVQAEYLEMALPGNPEVRTVARRHRTQNSRSQAYARHIPSSRRPRIS